MYYNSHGHLPTPAPNYRLAPLGIVLPGTDVGLLPVAVVAVGSAPKLGMLAGGMAALRPAWLPAGFLFCASFYLYYNNSRTRMSNSSRSVSIVL
jgi:hypothetical protein